MGDTERRRPASIPETTRRQLLKMFAAGGAVAATAIVGGNAISAAGVNVEAVKRRWCMVIDLRKCDGCDQCTVACQKAHGLSEDQRWINVYKMTGPSGQTFSMPRLCMQCSNPPCLRVCPTAATFMNKDGVVLVDQSICVGCRTCMAACPYEARYFNWTEPPTGRKNLLTQPMPEFPVPQRQGTVGKCILCVHNTATGKLPACVEACGMLAIWIGDLEQDIATNGEETVKLSTFLKEHDAQLFREELGTQPNVYYILGHGQVLEY